MFTLPPLDYEYSALEPYIDAVTMEIHHTKHHFTYVQNLNKALEGTEYSEFDLDKLLKSINLLPENIRQAVINNGGGHANHSFFWKIMTPRSTTPHGSLLDSIKNEFGSIESFKERFNEKAISLFGSGWTFLIVDESKRLRIKRHSFQNSPLMRNCVPILGIDLWEHAYYLKYQNRKSEYILAWWNLVNWDQAEENFKIATSHA
jgi:Fe-Mn family superoxide dismutase